MSIDHKITDKIEKLLRLSESSNEHEAEVAMKKAMSLLAEYNLTREDIKGEQKEPVGISFISEGKNFKKWKSTLLLSVCESFFCRLLCYSDGKYGIIGKDYNRQSAMGSYAYLLSVIEYRCAEELKRYNGHIHGIRFSNAFKNGMATKIALRLQENKNNLKASSGELVLVYDNIKKENDTYIAKTVGRVQSKPIGNQSYSSDGFYQGILAGAEVSLDSKEALNGKL